MKNIDITKDFIPVNFAVATISDTRKKENDKSGDILYEKIIENGHDVVVREILPDDINKIESFLLNQIKNNEVNVIITTGGTGLTGRDSTPEAVKNIIEKEIEGFGELFRMISYKKIGASSLQSRAIAGIAKGTFIFSIPGSPSACIDAWENILKFQLDNRFKPCNLIELIPRLLEK